MNRLTQEHRLANTGPMDDAAPPPVRPGRTAMQESGGSGPTPMGGAPVRLDPPGAPVLADDAAPYRIVRPVADVIATPLIFASPHSGRNYPSAMMAASLLDRQAIRRSEDAHVDELVAAAPSFGHTL